MVTDDEHAGVGSVGGPDLGECVFSAASGCGEGRQGDCLAEVSCLEVPYDQARSLKLDTRELPARRAEEQAKAPHI